MHLNLAQCDVHDGQADDEDVEPVPRRVVAEQVLPRAEMTELADDFDEEEAGKENLAVLEAAPLDVLADADGQSVDDDEDAGEPVEHPDVKRRLLQVLGVREGQVRVVRDEHIGAVLD
mmetsp:Transcript_26928/g.53933  ORF Transcript_26928/g.53933 Transcript_26928/m.53933 type:complete len:118 (+) Transcript_26928:136-489(+)